MEFSSGISAEFSSDKNSTAISSDVDADVDVSGAGNDVVDVDDDVDDVDDVDDEVVRSGKQINSRWFGFLR